MIDLTDVSAESKTAAMLQVSLQHAEAEIARLARALANANATISAANDAAAANSAASAELIASNAAARSTDSAAVSAAQRAQAELARSRRQLLSAAQERGRLQDELSAERLVVHELQSRQSTLSDDLKRAADLLTHAKVRASSSPGRTMYRKLRTYVYVVVCIHYI